MDTITDLLNASHLDSGKIALALVVMRVLGEAFGALKNGGGLIGLGRTILYGQGLPTVVAKDYHDELSAKPNDPTPPAP